MNINISPQNIGQLNQVQFFSCEVTNYFIKTREMKDLRDLVNEYDKFRAQCKNFVLIVSSGALELTKTKF